MNSFSFFDQFGCVILKLSGAKLYLSLLDSYIDSFECCLLNPESERSNPSVLHFDNPKRVNAMFATCLCVVE